MRTHEIRRRYLDYFTARGHVQLPSGSLVPPDWDTSVLITTAGMQPLKRYFLGVEQPPAPRATSVQKCFRTGDIDEVGNTARHLTFFEMMGNFSFGEYFKQYAIECAWDLSIREDGFALDPSRIWASVYEGDERVDPDEEAIALWMAHTGVPGDRIVRLGGDNFWQAGPTGPCGPCSELYYDRGSGARLRPPRVRSRLRVRPLPRVLEPGVPAVQHARGRRPRAAARAQRRHRLRPGARGRPDRGRALRLRDRRLRRRDPRDRGLVTRALRRERDPDQVAARARRPCARDDVPGQRRHRTLQRGPRLRAAPDHPPRAAACPADRPRGHRHRAPARRGGGTARRRLSGAARVPAARSRRCSRRRSGGSHRRWPTASSCCSRCWSGRAPRSRRPTRSSCTTPTASRSS